MPADQTIPQFAAAEGVPLDLLRKLLRRRGDLRQFCRTVGPTRVIPAAQLAAFRALVRTAISGPETHPSGVR